MEAPIYPCNQSSSFRGLIFVATFMHMIYAVPIYNPYDIIAVPEKEQKTEA